jgi:hypothetical protein
MKQASYEKLISHSQQGIVAVLSVFEVQVKGSLLMLLIKTIVCYFYVKGL